MRTKIGPPVFRLTRWAAIAASLALLEGCASTGRPAAYDLTGPEWDRVVRSVGLDPAEIVSPVSATPAMRRAAVHYAGGGTDKERLDRLQAALLDRREFAFDYDEEGTFTAAEAFEARRGNCVSFANLFIAFARSLGIRMQAALLLPRGLSQQKGEYLRTYSHLVAVPMRGAAGVYDFYRTDEHPDPEAQLGRIDDLEIAAIALSNAGVSALDEGKVAAAQDLLSKAVRLAPRLPDLHGNLGVALWRSGNIDAAFVCFRRGLDLDPHRAALLHNLAALYIELGRVHEAGAALAMASERQASPFLLIVKGDLEYAAGDMKGALRSYRQAHRKDPGLLEPLLRAARTARALGHERAARRLLEKARRLRPQDERVREMSEAPRVDG